MENGYFQVANVLSPLTSSTTNSLLYDADPCLYRIIQYFSGVLILHMQSRWNAEVVKSGRSDLIDKMVNEVIPYDPLPLATDTQFRFPLLSAYRTSESYEWKTIAWYHVTSEMNILYILPPLTSDQTEGLYPFLTHAARTLVDRTEETLDSNFNSGELVWQEAGLEEIKITSCTYGKIPGLKNGLNSNIYFPTVSLTLQCIEKRMPVAANFELFNGMDARVKVHEDGYCDCTVADVKS
jgi:hypothetical protein